MYICNKFAHFLLLIGLTSIWLLDQSEEPRKVEGKLSCLPHITITCRGALIHQIKIITKYQWGDHLVFIQPLVHLIYSIFVATDTGNKRNHINRGLLLNGNSHFGIALYALENKKKSKYALKKNHPGIFYYTFLDSLPNRKVVTVFFFCWCQRQIPYRICTPAMLLLLQTPLIFLVMDLACILVFSLHPSKPTENVVWLSEASLLLCCRASCTEDSSFSSIQLKPHGQLR